ncbi:MAG: hypothetical protein JWN70_5661 [Planctomycetaceae bacterium]|nr:hypothetical protein [Planctomycetaceae bacterium]
MYIKDPNNGSPKGWSIIGETLVKEHYHELTCEPVPKLPPRPFPTIARLLLGDRWKGLAVTSSSHDQVVSSDYPCR